VREDAGASNEESSDPNCQEHPAMTLPRIRFTIRWMMTVVILVAIALAIGTTVLGWLGLDFTWDRVEW
jgi:hypothetical protein